MCLDGLEFGIGNPIQYQAVLPHAQPTCLNTEPDPSVFDGIVRISLFLFVSLSRALCYRLPPHLRPSVNVVPPSMAMPSFLRAASSSTGICVVHPLPPPLAATPIPLRNGRAAHLLPNLWQARLVPPLPISGGSCCASSSPCPVGEDLMPSRGPPNPARAAIDEGLFTPVRAPPPSRWWRRPWRDPSRGRGGTVAEW